MGEGNGLGKFADFRMFSLKSRLSGKYSIEMSERRNTKKDKVRAEEPQFHGQNPTIYKRIICHYQVRFNLGMQSWFNINK